MSKSNCCSPITTSGSPKLLCSVVARRFTGHKKTRIRVVLWLGGASSIRYLPERVWVLFGTIGGTIPGIQVNRPMVPKTASKKPVYSDFSTKTKVWLLITKPRRRFFNKAALSLASTRACSGTLQWLTKSLRSEYAAAQGKYLLCPCCFL